MLVDDARIRELIKRVVGRRVTDESDREDLIQEAMIHLWLTETSKPGQTVSWYLRSCRYHVGKFLRVGRSIDSPKRSNGRVSLSDDTSRLKLSMEDLAMYDNTDMLASLCATEMVNILDGRLGDRDRSILRHLINGLGAREIANLMGISHPAVVKRRQRIARMALHLGFCTGRQLRWTGGTKRHGSGRMSLNTSENQRC